MSFPAFCPKCGSSTLGAEILIKGDLALGEFLSVTGLRTASAVPADVFYGVAALCPGCGAKVADFLLGDSRNSEVMADFNRKRELYEVGDSITAEMCVVNSCNVTFINPTGRQP